METKEVAQKLVDHCAKGDFTTPVDTLYSKDIVSVEPMSNANMPAEMRGIEAVKGKGDWWTTNHEVHGAKVEGPFIAGNRFSVKFEFDITVKATKKRIKMSEVALYTVSDGKIVREEFFYHPAGPQ